MKLSKTFASVALVSCGLMAENKKIFSTSFEDLKPGVIKEDTVEAEAVWKASEAATVFTTNFKTGKQCIKIKAGKNQVFEFALDGSFQNAKGLAFQAERWTRKKPFSFTVSAKIDDKWKEIQKLDNFIQVGGYNKVGVEFPAESTVKGVKFTCTSAGGVLIDDLELLEGKPTDIATPPKVATEQIRNIVKSEDLFVSTKEKFSKTGKTHTFRIPAIITAANGDLIAVCDARRENGADLIWVRDIDIAIRRSTDNGKTWTDMELLYDFGGVKEGRGASDPSLILNEKTGEIFCFYNYMDQVKSPKEFRLHVQSSKDHGKTWSEPRDITDSITKPEWKMDFKFITSGRGIYTKEGEMLHTLVNLKNGLHLFGSKDDGKTWYLKDVAIKPGNESKVIQLADGSLMINCRWNGRGMRYIHRSTDQGQTWVSEADKTLVDPGCNGAILRYTAKSDGYAKDRLLFVNANSQRGRKNLTVKLSYDEGKTWTDGKVIDPGASAYSDITILADGSIGILYEPGYKAVRYTQITLEDLTDGEDKLSKPYKVPGSK